MAIDPRIALGVQPVQPVNMLGMAAQGMALQAAAEEMESSRGLKEALAGGMSPTDPRLLQYGRQGREAYKVAQEGRAKQIEMANKTIGLVGNAAGFVRNNPTPDNFNAVLRDLVSQGIYTPEQAQRALDETQNDPTKIKALADRMYVSSMDAEKQLPKYFSQDIGGAYQIVGVNPVTGKPEVVSRTGKTLTPGQAMEERRRVEQGAQINQILGGGGTAPVNSMITAPVGAPVNRMITPPATAPVVAPVAAPVAPTAAPAPSAADVEGSSTATISDTAAVNNVDKITSQITQLRSAAMMGNTRAGEAADQLEKQLNLVYPKLTPEIQNFNFARQQGFQGSFTDWSKDRAPTLTEITDPTNPKQTLRVNARDYKGGGVGSPGVLGVVKTGNLTTQQEIKLKNEIAQDYKSLEAGMAMTDEMLESIDALRNSNLGRVTGQLAGRTLSFSDEGQIADTRIENLRGKITALGKASAAMTGAIGAIANQEWKILADQIAIVDATKGEKAMLEQVKRLEDMVEGTANRMRTAYERQYGEYADLAPEFFKDIPKPSYVPGKYTPTGVNPEYKAKKGVAKDTNTSVTVNGTTYVFPNAEAAAKFKKAAGVK